MRVGEGGEYFALCQKEFTGVPLIGISIPMSSTNAHKKQAKWVGDNYCDAFEEFDGWEANGETKPGNFSEIFDVLEMIIDSIIHNNVFYLDDVHHIELEILYQLMR